MTGVSSPTKKEREEITYDPDPYKARAIVREGHEVLWSLAAEIAKVTANQKLKARLQNAVDRFKQAEREYATVEVRPANYSVGWLGGPNGFYLVDQMFRETAPEHKLELVLAWNETLLAVNEATKVGVFKRSRCFPITLQADVDQEREVKTAVAVGRWD